MARLLTAHQVLLNDHIKYRYAAVIGSLLLERLAMLILATWLPVICASISRRATDREDQS